MRGTLLRVLKNIAAVLAAIAPRRDARMGLEDALQMALVGKAQLAGDIGQGAARLQAVARAVHAQVQLIRMRRHAGGGAEGSDQLKAAHAGQAGQLFQARQRLRLQRLQHRLQLRGDAGGGGGQGACLAGAGAGMQEGQQRCLLVRRGGAREQQRIHAAELRVQCGSMQHRGVIRAQPRHLALQPMRVEVQHLVAPVRAGQGIAGVYAAGRHQHQAAGTECALAAMAACKNAAARVDGADGIRGMAVRLVTRAAAAGAPALHVGEQRIAPEGGIARHGYIKITSYCFFNVWHHPLESMF